MPSVCAVADCQNISSHKTRRPGLTFHRFPVNNPKLCKIWVTKCKRDKIAHPENCRVCSDHFKEEDYERDLKNELLNLPLKRKLKSTAIPSVFLTRTALEVDKRREERSLQRIRNKTITDLLNESFVERNTVPDMSNKAQFDVFTQTTDAVNLEMKELQLQIETYKQELQIRDKELTKKGNQILHLKSKIRTLAGKVCRLEKEKGILKRKACSLNIFSDSQVKKLSGIRRVNWSLQDVVKALTVRSISLKAYETAATVWNLPLPGVSTLRSWTKNFTCSPGILSEVMEVMKQNLIAIDADTMSRLCALCFDEMGLDSKYVHDPTFDQIVSHSKVMVIEARGLCSSWKQPVYFDFDSSMTRDTIVRCVFALEDAGFRVWSITSDMGGENRAFWNEFDISPEVVSFTNPCDQDRQIYIFSDVPHDMKNLRSHLIDDGVVLEDGTLIDRDMLECMIENNGKEIKLCPKFVPKLLEVKGAERMRVAPAVQLLSNHMAALAHHLFPEKPSVTNFFEIVNNGFDVLNSRIPKDEKNPLKSAFGMSIAKQKEALLKLRHLLLTMRFRTKKLKNVKTVMLPFQSGFVTSINALLGLYSDLQTKYQVTYVLTSRLNQDCLESFFSVIRSFSGLYSNPTPPEFRYRLRLVLLGCRIRPPKGTNALFDERNVTYVSGSLMRSNKLVNDQFEQESEPSIDNLERENILERDDILEHSDYPSEEGLRYIAGYLAWNLKRLGLRKYGVPSSMMRTEPQISNNPQSWIEKLSRGGLLIPDDQILGITKVCEKEFNRLYPELRFQKNISAKLVEHIIAKYSTLDSLVIKYYVQTRLRIKVKCLNEAKLCNKVRKRKAKQFAKGVPKDKIVKIK